MGMLVLQRKQNECLLLTCENGDQIWVRVHKLSAGSVRIGVDAPKSVRIDRAEQVRAFTPEALPTEEPQPC